MTKTRPSVPQPRGGHTKTRPIFTCTAAVMVILSAGHPSAQKSVDWDDAQTQMDMNICESQMFEYTDQKLHKTYQLGINHWPGGRYSARGQALLAAQRAWIDYRDAHCAAVAFEYEGGSMQPPEHAGWMERLTRARTNAIRTYLEPYQDDDVKGTAPYASAN